MIAARVGILNLEIGNLRSVSNAVYSLGHDPVFVSKEEELEELTHLIVPGVGAFRAAACALDRLRVREAVRDFAASGRPTLGLCLGMQLLATVGEEGGDSPGLGLVDGRVRRLPDDSVPAVPHVGWNAVDFVVHHPVFAAVKSGVDFYFVHSYYFAPNDDASVLGTTEYGARFASAVGRSNIVGFQFHPEKSQANGLKLLDNFCGWDGAC